VTFDPALVGGQRSGLFQTAALGHVEVAELRDSYVCPHPRAVCLGIMIEGGAGQDLHSRGPRLGGRQSSVATQRESSNFSCPPTACAIPRDVGLYAAGRDAKTKSLQFVIPDREGLRLRGSGVHGGFGQMGDVRRGAMHHRSITRNGTWRYD
jgi:hypothetical protein